MLLRVDPRKDYKGSVGEFSFCLFVLFLFYLFIYFCFYFLQCIMVLY